MKIATFFVFMLMSLSVLAQTNFDNVIIKPVKVTDKIYMLKGSGGNIGVLLGEDGILMIDDQFAPLSEKITEALARLQPGPVRFLINTHVHGDHVGGNENFSKAGASIIAHESVRSVMMKEVDPPLPRESWPILTFSKDISLHLNGEDIEVSHFGRAHTDGDVVIYFKQANVYHTGDVFVRYGYPYIDISNGGTVKGFIEYLDKLITMMNESTKVIPGHGELATKKDVTEFRNIIKDIYDGTVAALKKGVKLEDITSIDIATKYDSSWGAGKGKDFVFMIAENYLKAN